MLVGAIGCVARRAQRGQMALERLALRRGAPSAAHGGRTDSAFLALQRRALFGGRPPLTLRTPWPVAPLVGGARAAGARLPSSSASDALHHNHHQQQQAYSSKRPKAPTAAAAAAAGDVVEGIVRSVTFASDSGFRVLRVELDAATLQRLQLPKSHLAKHSRNQVVVTGMLHDVVEGMLIRWVQAAGCTRAHARARAGAQPSSALCLPRQGAVLQGV